MISEVQWAGYWPLGGNRQEQWRILGNAGAEALPKITDFVNTATGNNGANAGGEAQERRFADCGSKRRRKCDWLSA